MILESSPSESLEALGLHLIAQVLRRAYLSFPHFGGVDYTAGDRQEIHEYML